YRMTNQRQVILEEIQKVNTHPTADEVYRMVRLRLPRISLGTVYRNLEILFESGLIQKIGPVSNQKRFDGKTENHYHIRCSDCGKVEDALVESIDSIYNTFRDINNFNVTGHKLEFFGICPDCKKRKNLS
ncbi:MAG TPA: transcriptional repressor, partial [Desulfatiglandales bacterium]|nr:transcriptional repressor [Desulfatiglandales bacterium]